MLGGTPDSYTRGIRGQFLDAIEYTNDSDLLVYKWYRADNEIKTGSKLIVREGQIAVFVQGSLRGDAFRPGNYTLDTGSLPILNKLKAIPFALNSPIKSDLYFIDTTVKQGRNWGTKHPIAIKDADIGICRLRAFGSFTYKVIEPITFMREIFGSRALFFTLQIENYIRSVILQSLTDTLGTSGIPALELAGNYMKLSNTATLSANKVLETCGISLKFLVIENISLPDKVEEHIDKMSNAGLYKQNEEAYRNLETLEIMRDAAKQENGLVGAGMGMQLGSMLAQTINSQQTLNRQAEVVIKCATCGELNNSNNGFCGRCGNKL